MFSLVVRIALWGFMAFWLWLGLGATLMTLRVPRPFVVASVLSWIGGGLALPWALPVVDHWLRWFGVPGVVLTMR